MSIIRLRSAKGKARASYVPPPEEGQARLLRLHRRLAAVGAVLGIVIGVIAFLPASFVVDAVASATKDQFLLAEADGTIWNGSALTVLTGGQGSRDASVLPSRLEWRLRPRWNGLALHLAQDCCLPHGVDIGIRRRLGAWQVTVEGPSDLATPASVVAQSPASAAVVAGAAAALASAGAAVVPIAQYPASWLEGRGFPFNTVHPGGLLILTTHNLAFALQNGRWFTTGSAQLEIRQASSRLSTLDTLGSYKLALVADPPAGTAPELGSERMRITLSTIEGALIADGAGELGPGGLHFHGQAKAAPGSESALNNLLNLIGRRNGALSVISIG